MQHRDTSGRAHRIWGNGAIRAFLSHVADDKIGATELKTSLARYGIGAFVAHEQIEVSRDWQIELKFALGTMDVLVALCTPGFNESSWANQEVGFAIGSGKPVIAIRNGADPSGFQTKYQAMSASDTSWDEVARDILRLLVRRDDFRDLVPSALADAFSKSRNFNESRVLLESLQEIETLTMEQAGEIVEAVNSNIQINSSYVLGGEFKEEFLQKLVDLIGDSYEIAPNLNERRDGQAIRFSREPAQVAQG